MLLATSRNNKLRISRTRIGLAPVDGGQRKVETPKFHNRCVWADFIRIFSHQSMLFKCRCFQKHREITSFGISRTCMGLAAVDGGQMRVETPKFHIRCVWADFVRIFSLQSMLFECRFFKQHRERTNWELLEHVSG